MQPFKEQRDVSILIRGWLANYFIAVWCWLLTDSYLTYSISKVKMSVYLTWSPLMMSKIRYFKINKAKQNFNKILKWKRKWLFARLIHCIIKGNWMWHERFPASVLVTVELNQSIKFCDLPLHYLKCSIWSQSQNQPFWLVLSVLLVSLALMLFPQQTIAKCTVLATDRKCPTLCCTHQWISASSGPRAHSSTFCIRLLCWSIDLIQHPLSSISLAW